MFKYLVICVFVILSVVTLVAQDSYKYIELGKGTILFDSLDYYVSTVVDKRPSKESIGVIQKGVLNKKWPAKFKNGIENEVLGYLTNLMPPRDHKEALTVVIHNIWISERIKISAEYGVAEVTIEIFRSDDMINSLGKYSSLVESRGLDVTKAHPRRVRMAIFDCIEYFKDRPIFGASHQSLNFDNGIPDSLKIGFYKDFNQLINNQPIVKDDRVSMSRKTINSVVKRYTINRVDKPNKKHKDYMYFDGKAILINGGYVGGNRQYYLRNCTTGRYLLFIDRYSDSDNSFGVIGYVASSKIRNKLLDMSTGFIKEINDEQMLNILISESDIYNKYMYSDKKAEDIKIAIQALNDKISSQ